MTILKHFKKADSHVQH